MRKPKYITKLDKVTEFGSSEIKVLDQVTEEYAFRTNDYYNSLIDWNDPDDPIRRISIPHPDELHTWGELDPSNEEAYTQVPGLQHKYLYTALLLVNDVCGAYCRFCFRKRLFMDKNDEVIRDVQPGLEYIRNNNDINNVLLTGGDPLVLSTPKLEPIIAALREIDHVKIIRIGSKMPAFNPFRIIDDPSLTEMFAKYSLPDKRIYMMAHFNHPRELTDESRAAMDKIRKAGVVTVNQTPLLKGINDNPHVLGELFNKLSYAGIPPYYLFQCRPTAGNKMFSIPIEKGFEIFEKARTLCSGLAKRARYVMSHSTGKIEMVGMTEEHVFFRYHRAANPEEKARFMVFDRNPDAYWFDDYGQIVSDHFVVQPSEYYGPE